MAIISAAVMTQLETLAGEAYDLIQGSQGDVNTPDTVAYLVSQVKLVLRGGLGLDFGLVPVNELDPADSSGQVYLTAPTYAVYVPSTSAVFGGLKRTVPGGDYIVGEDSYASGSMWAEEESFYSLLTIRDISQGGVAQATVVNYRGYISRDGPPVIPTYPVDTEVPLALIKIQSSGIATADVDLTIQPWAYRSGVREDQQIRDLFTVTDTLENYQLTRTRYSEFSSWITSLQTHVRTQSGSDFRQYWKAQGYQFTRKFRKLYSDATGTDLSVNLGGVGAGVSSFSQDLLYQTSQLEGVMGVGGGDATSQVALYCIRDTAVYPEARLAEYLAPNATSIKILTMASWPSEGFLGVKSIGTWCYIGSYTKSTATTASIQAAIATVPAWSRAYNLTRELMWALPSVATGSTVSVGTAQTRYLGAAGATISIPSTTGLSMVIRSK